jgi:hypothetical protein
MRVRLACLRIEALTPYPPDHDKRIRDRIQ